MNLPIKLGKIIKCLNCGDNFQTGRKHRGIKYCSRNCWNIHWKGKHTHMWGKHPILSKQGRENIVTAMKGNKYAVGHSSLKGIKRPQFSNENHPRWITDRTQLAKRQERNDSAYKEWRLNVWKRDNFKCKIVNSDCNGKIIAHHILGYKKFPELRYEVNNGITLCQFHHPRKRKDEIKLSPIFQELVVINNNLNYGELVPL